MPMSTSAYRVSHRGQMALPVEARKRWGLEDGGSVEIADLGDALLIVPAGRDSLSALLHRAIEESGGYGALVAEATRDEPDLA